mgnify:CR=1 FL=1
MPTPTRWQALLPLVVGTIVVLGVDHVVFGPEGPYWPVTKPQSYAGKVATVRRLHAERPPDPARTVLMLGDSRIRVGVLPQTVERTSGGRVDAELGAVEGTRLRMWSFLVRRLDPDRNRYAAVVVPLLEANDRDLRFTGGEFTVHPERSPTDLRALLPLVAPWDAVSLLPAVDTWETFVPTLRTIFLKGLVYRDDLAGFVEGPDQRRRTCDSALRAARRVQDTGRPLGGTLAGLRWSEETERVKWPRRKIKPLARERIAASLRQGVPESKGDRAAYLQRWLGALVDHYEGSRTRVILLPIPRAPLVRESEREAPVDGFPARLAEEGRVILLDQDPIRDFERPRFFGDHVHLNRQGSTAFSEHLGRELARVLGDEGGD